MSKCRSMYAGSSGAVYNVNGMHPGNGNNKWQGLVSTTNMRSSIIPYVRTRADSDNRNVVFCMNQLGGVGRKSTMFATTADGVKLPCQGSGGNNFVNEWASRGLKIDSLQEWSTISFSNNAEMRNNSVQSILNFSAPEGWFLIRGTPLVNYNEIIRLGFTSSLFIPAAIRLKNSNFSFFIFNTQYNIDGVMYTAIFFPGADLSNSISSFFTASGVDLYWVLTASPGPIAHGSFNAVSIYRAVPKPSTYKNYETAFYIKLGSLASFNDYANELGEPVKTIMDKPNISPLNSETVSDFVFVYHYGSSSVLNVQIEVDDEHIYYDPDLNELLVIAGYSITTVSDTVKEQAINELYNEIGYDNIIPVA